MRITKKNIFKEIDKRNYLEVLKSDLVDKVKDNDGYTPLHELAWNGIKEVLHHPSVDKVKDKDVWTPLHWLAWRDFLTKEDLRERFPWYKKEIKNIWIAVEEIVNTTKSIQFILEDS